jgi:hypothetical protein
VNVHQLTVLGLALAIAGALVYVWGAAVMIIANRSYRGPSEGQHRNEKTTHLVGAVLLTIGFAFQLTAAIIR